MDDSPAYYAAIALHPAYRWAFFEDTWAQQDWLSKAKKLIQELWQEEYKYLPAPHEEEAEAEAAEPVPKRLKVLDSKFGRFRKAARYQDCGDNLSPSASFSSASGGNGCDEFERWQADVQKADEDVTDPLLYWHQRRREYPRLSQMALNVLSVAAMSAEVERLFSSSGAMVSADRCHLDANTVSLCQCIRSWYRAGLIKLSNEDMLQYSVYSWGILQGTGMSPSTAADWAYQRPLWRGITTAESVGHWQRASKCRI